jgi:hypothetical protein
MDWMDEMDEVDNRALDQSRTAHSVHLVHFVHFVLLGVARLEFGLAFCPGGLSLGVKHLKSLRNSGEVRPAEMR